MVVGASLIAMIQIQERAMSVSASILRSVVRVIFTLAIVTIAADESSAADCLASNYPGGIYALVEANQISGPNTFCSLSSPTIECDCGRGTTVDDTQNATVTKNTVNGCQGDGILLANGAHPANKPWWVSGNYVRCNTVQSNGGYGLGSARNPLDPADHNIYNVWHDNTLALNSAGACFNNGEQNTFYNNGFPCFGNNPPDPATCQ